MVSGRAVMMLAPEPKRLVDTGKQPGLLPSEQERIEAAARSRLRRSGYGQLQVVSCEFHEGVLTLRGRVSSYYLKQVVQSLVMRMDGVVEVNNRVEVV
jgi:osmotically-inducible protein OsmY